nr:MAG TPA: hypothetical protein [Crassvirales sp.]
MIINKLNSDLTLINIIFPHFDFINLGKYLFL